MFPPGGYLAVCFLFVLSGFSMTIGYRDRILNTDFSYSNYITKRLTKFYPLHWLVLFYIIIRQSFAFIHQPYGVTKFVTNFLLLQSFVPLKDFYFSFNSPSWYLCNTLFYCFLFPFILRFICKSNKKVRNTIPCVLITIYVLLVFLIPPKYHDAILYINPFVRIIDFILGIYTGLFFLNQINTETQTKHNNRILLFVGIMCVVIVACCSFLQTYDCYIYIVKFYWIIFCPMILVISLISYKKNGGGKTIISRLLQLGGQYSFTFYMIHLVCIGLLGAICRKLNMEMWLTVILSFMGTMMTSVICQKIFVNPIGIFLMTIINKYGNNQNKY